VRVRRASEREPRLPREVAVVAVQPLAQKQALVLDALLRTGGAELGGRRVELDIGCWHALLETMNNAPLERGVAIVGLAARSGHLAFTVETPGRDH
jgi:hypothetical protein